MQNNGIESGACVVCNQMAYVGVPQFEKDGNVHIHWSCKPENQAEMKRDELKRKFNEKIKNMTLEELSKLSELLFS